MDSFQIRCEKDPQGVIKDLLGQTSRQAAAIHNISQNLLEQDEAISLYNHLVGNAPIDMASSKTKVILKKLQDIFNPPKPPKEPRKKKNAKPTEGKSDQGDEGSQRDRSGSLEDVIIEHSDDGSDTGAAE